MSLRSTVAVRCRQRRTKNSLNKNYNYTEHIGALQNACSHIGVCRSLEITFIAFDINSTASTMESEYDRKFEDMKKYIPFLESMIKRLESTSSLSSNPRQAQLDKIRSLRDLLLDKKKRMKMENLLKCEQVLINLYAKVEQRDTLPNTKKTTNSGVSDSSRMESNSKLDIVRSKLKRVTKIQDGADTLPEIVRASDVEDVCMPGSVEPALFQRRPHKKSPTLSDISSSSQEKPKSPEGNSKRKYTRVLYSPEPESRPRSVDQDTSSGSALFSRRSPKKSTSHNKKEGSKPASHKTQKDTKDFNITLNVPQESLNSLNTDDILSRIITCNDNDVDIETLRGLRSQILSELKQTGANDDISDLILKSYAAKKSTKAKEEVEEGELSDSESEAIEKIYGNLVRENKDNTNNEVKSAPEKDQPRKIQICLVINPKDTESSIKSLLKPVQDGKEDLELIGDIKNNQSDTIGAQAEKSDAKLENTSDVVIIDDDDSPVKEQEFIKVHIQVTESKDVTLSTAIKTNDQIADKNETSQISTSIKTDDTIDNKKESNITMEDTTMTKTNDNDDDKSKSHTMLDKDTESLDLLKNHEKQCDPCVQFKANFYKPLLDEENNGSSNSVNKLDECPAQLAEPKISPINISPFDKNECVKIPLLGEPIICNKPPEKDIDSQIDILQALKNEILGDNILSGPSHDVATPPLHQPKITKVSHAQEIMPKKRISIEKYKEKTTPATLNSSQSVDAHLLSPKDDNVKKQSLKLTEKECERFNFPVKIDMADDVSSEDEDQKQSNMSSLDVYENFAPKSPDHDDTHFSEKTQPVIIPIDPIKGPVANFKADVDMRTLPLLSPKEIPVISNSTPVTYCQKSKEIKTKDIKLDIRVDMPSRNQSPLIDPRMNRDANQSNKIDSSNLAGMNVDNNFTPCVTPTTRSYDMTPSRLNDYDVPNTSHNHVYTPSFSSFDSRDSSDQFILKDACSPRDSEIGIARRKSRREEYNDHDSRSNFSPTDNIQRSKYTDTYKPDVNTGNVIDRHGSDQNDDSVRVNRPMTPLPVFGWSDGSLIPNSYARSDGPVPLMVLKFGRPDCPATPSHPFGRSDCPSAPGHPFPRLDMPGTPNHPFGRPECRSECPATPIHPFGRADCPPTPTHQFGRSDIPPTPNPMLGRSDCPSTPTHPFGRIDCPPSLNNPFARMDFPSTPNHPFGMSDCPGTPSHPFGRTDCSPTRNHQLGRLECPQTPTHPFGMSESTTSSSHQYGRGEGGMAPKYSFGRSEQLQNIPIIQPYSKDPRLNRRSESRSQRDERDNRNYKDRNFSTNNSYQMQSRHFNRSESHTNSDRDGRLSRSMSRNERNFGHSKYRENYLDQPSSADKRSSYNYDNRSRCRERSTDDRNRRGKSPGRNNNSREHYVRSNSRGRSVSRNDNRRTENDNIVSFKSIAGRSYAIDTSVNSTFQELLKKKGLEIRDPTFDSRKQRAASLGRSVALRSNEERIYKNISAHSIAEDSKYRSKNYRRASSVGRDLLDKHESLQSVKADFKNYQAKVAKQHEIQRHSQRNKKCFDNQIDKTTYKTSKIDKPAYSPRKNSRDPRMRREYDDKNKHGGEKHKHGINYSNDNLARGVVLNSGYGVKNYKIPKIKRVTNENQDEVKLNNDKNNVEKKEKKDTSKVIEDTTGKSTLSEDRTVSERSPERRLLRSFKAGKNVAVSTKKTRIEIRKPRRPVIYDSSSDEETNVKNTLSKNVLSSDDEKCNKLKDLEKSKNDQTVRELVTNSGTDKNETVVENVEKPVVDNIKNSTSNNDGHIDSCRTESNDGLKYITSDEDLSNMESIDVSKENTFEDIFNKDNVIDGKIVDVPHDENVTTGKVVPCIDNLSKTLIQNLDESNSKAPATSTEANKFDADKNQIDNDNNKVDNVESPTFKCKTDTHDVNDEGVLLKNTDETKTNTNSDAIVSTTENDKDVTNMQEEIVKSTENNELNYETSAADSTNEVINDKTKDHNVPDSTNDVHSDMNSLVSSSFSSTHVPTKLFAEANLSQPDLAQPLNSYGSILSILQDKSKIHQLLSMIEESADNNKLKRKLEKLSEIVSDDEEEAFDKTANKPNDLSVTNKEDVDEIANIQIKTPLAEQVIETKLQNESEIVGITNAENVAEDKVTTLELPDNPKEDEESKALPKVNAMKKGKGPRKGKGRFTKANKSQRVTRAAAGNVVKIPTVKKPSRELMKLREDIKEMFLTDEMLNSTGIRMCRLAKLVDEKSSNRKDETQETKPAVVIEKCKEQDNSEEAVVPEKSPKKKVSSKIKRKVSANEDSINEDTKAADIKPKTATKLFTVPKSKNKSSSKQEDKDPYEYESDSLDTGTVKGSESEGVSDCETNSLASSKSFGSSEVLAELQKKTKRKRRGKAWQTGIIKPKHKKKKIKFLQTSVDADTVSKQKNIPDNECFIDKFYCFEKNVTTYSCRLCEYTGDDIVIHYKKQHPHTEIPLSRMNPVIAKEAVEQCQEVNFPTISKISTDRYVCRFCFKEFSKNKSVLETFFWHVVSMHTGEYKQACSECVNNTCHFNLDIPPPPKDNSGQLIGYLCDKCNFTQVSLENLKTHVIGRHNDEQTDVYTINLAAMSKKTLKTLAKQQSVITPRVLRSLRSNQSCESTDDLNETVESRTVIESVPQNEAEAVPVKIEKKTYVSSMQTKIAFESEEMITESDPSQNDHDNSVEIKQENIETEEQSHLSDHAEPEVPESNIVQIDSSKEETQLPLPDDVMAHAHFKISYKESGAKEYVCCINGKENHYKTTLLISMKKHVQCKHAESWDGYCVLCKVIVTTQGPHNFRDCLQHFIDKHLDEFPVLEIPKAVSPIKIVSDVTEDISKSFINVRPLNQLLFNNVETETINDTTTQFPKIESVVSLGAAVSLPQSSPTYPPVLCIETQEEKQYRYEDWQAEVMSKKHRVVLNPMMSEGKLVKVFKCTGKFCSFTTDNAENALLHATTHQDIGGEGALNCSYCDFDASNNGIDLVMHVFKAHGKCPYACKLCFYRATSSQLVNSHVRRMHSERQSFDAILHSTTIATPVADDHNLMSREEAVPYYICGYPSSEGEGSTCKYKTFTPGQFGEHLVRHRPPYPCNMCQSSLNSVSDLIHHMKTHGLRLYQCAFCVFGANNEAEMLAHASSRHPDRLPQAYLRVVTNKDGSAELRVLPRAFLNKVKTPSRDVTSVDTDNPVIEAKRSVALEKLIGDTESATSIEPIQAKNDADDDDVPADIGIVEDSEQLLVENTEQEPVPPAVLLTPDRPSRKSSTASLAPEIQTINQEDDIKPVVKTEPGVSTPNVPSDSVIYCLDSDEETRPRVIDISDDDLGNIATATSKAQEPTTYVKVSLDRLFLCPKCKTYFRNTSGFKRHISTCLSSLSVSNQLIQCPHDKCTEQIPSILAVTDHYFKNHADRKVTIYSCGICKAKFKTAPLTKKHMKEMHKSVSFTMNEPVAVEGDTKVCTIIEMNVTPSATVRRKSSADAAKQKRYGPQDIDQLPINPILESLVYCSLCEFNTKVRLNMVRHLQLHAEQQPVPQTAPVNPVPHLETNERHFDKMLNLASSSIINRTTDKANKVDVLPIIPANEVGRYPKYVPDRMRYTCGTKNCSYISVDEAMLRIHWETLHSTTNDYLCVHCPPHQHLDQSKPLTAVRIIGHLKMHEADLYACSVCCYYHFKRVVVEKHLQKCLQLHKDAHVMVVREGGVTPTPAPAPTAAAPTMDLKPWQCGLCSFKSMLRPEVADHCFKIHQSKMQYKCNYCPFRTSGLENVAKHQANSHSDKVEDVFYYYYREGSIPDDDGTPRWIRQKQRSGAAEPVVKTELSEPSTSQCDLATITPTPVAVNLSLVKQEIEDPEIPNADGSIQELCEKFGRFCEPSGLKYKCPLCTAVLEDTALSMQSHLFEELKYRKWGCSVCSYKAFHKTGLNEHIKSEHRRQYQEPIELPTDVNVEKWVAGLLEYQTECIAKNKLLKQTEEVPSSSKNSEDVDASFRHLVQAFGSLGTPRDNVFCCPKCNCTFEDERAMKEHLEIELTKIRWCCSNCSFMSSTYHEAQFHCKSAHPGESASPREALRSADKRADWVDAVLYTQKRALKPSSPVHTQEKNTDLPDPNDNSLLVVRYEEPVPSTSEDTGRRKRSAPADSDEEKLVIDETEIAAKKKSSKDRFCPFCDFKTKWANALREHVLRHYNLKPFKCRYCGFSGYRPMVLKHFEKAHPEKRLSMIGTPIPTGPPTLLVLPKNNTKKTTTATEDTDEQICLQCEQTVAEKDLASHTHGDNAPDIVKKGQVVVKCCICSVLRSSVPALFEHHKECHPDVTVNYAYFKLKSDTQESYYCYYCNSRFNYIADLKSHHRASHNYMELKYNTNFPHAIVADEESNAKRKNEDSSIEPKTKRVAKKSTTKLPHNAVAKKSTTKLPHSVKNTDEDMDEYSYYGSKPPTLDNYCNVTTLMPFCNTMVPFTVKKLSEIIKIEPIVLVDKESS